MFFLLKHKYSLLLFFLLSCNVILAETVGDPFKMNSQSTYSIPIGKTFSQSDSINPFDSNSQIRALGITGNIVCKGHDYIVRIILEDANGKDYLVLESYRGVDDADVINLNNYGQETLLLNNIKPIAIKFFIKNAELHIDDINIQTANNPMMLPANKEAFTELRRQQAERVAKKINTYNAYHNKLWRAGVTPLSMMDYEQRRDILGASDDASTLGFEYYTTGIFEIGEPQAGYSEPKSKFIDHFDWRNRHGKNWMTPEKDQGNSGYCVAFSVVSATEALANIYYNRMLNLDLSEEKIACCSDPNRNTYQYGMYFKTALDYMKTNGTCDEIAYPFVDAPSPCRSDEITPNLTVAITNYTSIGKQANDNVKQALIQNGPLVSGIITNGKPRGINHAMTLVGYKVLAVGDTAYIINKDKIGEGVRLIEENDPQIGMTCWIFKDNYANHWHYFPVVFHDINGLNSTFSITGPIKVSGMSDKDILCEDADGDGFYCWGLGSKPASCPPDVPDEQDGDDSNPLIGPMDKYGYMESLDPALRDTIHIMEENNTYSCTNIYNHIVVENTTWTISKSMTFYNGATVTVKNGATLIVDNSSTLNNIQLIVEKGSHFAIKEQSTLKMLNVNDFNVPIGATLDLYNGNIE